MALKRNEKNQYDERKRKLEVKIFRVSRRTSIGGIETRVEIRSNSAIVWSASSHLMRIMTFV